MWDRSWFVGLVRYALTGREGGSVKVSDARWIERLEEQIAAAKSGNPDDFDLWRNETEVVLRNAVGVDNPIYTQFRDNRYTLQVWTSNTSQSEINAACKRGVLRAVSMLRAAIKEIELTSPSPRIAPGAATTGSTIFVVHGRDEARKEGVARFLGKLTSKEPVILHEQASAGDTIIEKLEKYAATAGYAVVIATGDDRGCLAGEDEYRPRARQNVIFELGYFFGLLGRKRVALLYDTTVERPSDTDGIVHIPFDDANGWRSTLAREIEDAGLEIDWSALR